MKRILRVLNYLYVGPSYDRAVFFAFITSFFSGTSATTLKTYTPEELTEALRTGTSLIRLGDGEAMLMTGRDIHYQKTSPALNHELRTIINQQNQNYIIALPVEALTATDRELKDRRRFRIWRLFRTFAKTRLDLTQKYADAHCFYRQAYLKKVLPVLFTDKHIICLSKKSTLDQTLRQYLETLAPQVTFIESPSSDAYAVIDSLTSKIELSIRTSTLTPLLVLSAGPASKVLAYRFVQKQVQSLDIGHGLEIVGRDLDYSDKI